MCGRPCSLRSGRANIPYIYNEVGMSKWIVAGLLVLLVVARADAQATKPATTRAVTQEDLEREFAEMLSGSTLVGKFTEERLAIIPCAGTVSRGRESFKFSVAYIKIRRKIIIIA